MAKRRERRKKSRPRAPTARQGTAARSRASLKARLSALALDFRWTWTPEALELWREIARELPPAEARKFLRSPYAALAAPSRALARALRRADLIEPLEAAEEALRRRPARETPPVGVSPRAPVAYFSMEYGLHESLPIYAGGLGVLAGDHLKSATDLGVPLVALGLFYPLGYFRQELSPEGRQIVRYPRSDPRTLPLEPVRAGGKALQVPVELPGGLLRLRAWRVKVGSVDLYLLDGDHAGNPPPLRKITRRLYVGDRELRFAQELALGVGGVRLLRALGIRPGVWHLNEGHVVLMQVERLRELAARGVSGVAAIETVAADTVFTTHTPVPEGNEVFDPALAARYLAPHLEAAGIEPADFFRLGLDHDPRGRPVVSFTVLALRLSRFRNGVSALHGEVARRMWSKLWPGFRPEEVPITSVTNGVHTASWVAPAFDSLYKRYIARDWRDRTGDPRLWRRAEKIPEREIWEIKRALKEDLIRFVRERHVERWRRWGLSREECEARAAELLDPEALTIGFARRFAPYKRAALLFHDLRRAERLFRSRKRPVQVIYSGKPHPEDPVGAALFEKIARIAKKPAFRGKVVLLEDYDIEIARRLVQGVDVWLNNPRRPLEASGTSGEKVPINCGLNVSVLDGWWCEGYRPEAGWAVGGGEEFPNPREQDRHDHAALIRVLEREVIPLYYRRDRGNIPRAWLKKVKASLSFHVPRFSTAHMVGEYAERLYRPAAENGLYVRAERYAAAKRLAEWRRRVERSWPLIYVRGVNEAPAGRARRLEVEVFLADLDPPDVAFLDGRGELLPVAEVRDRGGRAWTFLVEGVPASRLPQPPVRLFPTHPELVHAQELGLALEVFPGGPS